MKQSSKKMPKIQQTITIKIALSNFWSSRLSKKHKK